MARSLLEVRDLSISYRSDTEVRAVREVSLKVAEGEALALVGETGSGKSTLALALLGLLENEAHLQSGEILFEGRSLKDYRECEWRDVRGLRMGMVFQDARSALNPILKIGDHLVESIRAHRKLSRRKARRQALDLLCQVGIAEPQRTMDRYPFELSGGMCQRVGIAMGICNKPRLLIADEPTSAVDTVVQSQILCLLQAMKRDYKLALLLISHDLALVSEFADRVSVMYDGRLVESGLKDEVLASPAHPYTRGLIECQPDLAHQHEMRPLPVIPGAVPTSGRILSGCAFAPRCVASEPRCEETLPSARELSQTHWASCMRIENQTTHPVGAAPEL